MKKIIGLIFVAIFALSSFFVTGNSAEAAFSHKAGDILITKSTSSAGLTGHAGIVSSTGAAVIHVSGKGARAGTLTISDWYKKYPATKVVRHSNTTTAYNAARWAYDYYILGSGSDTDYRVTTNPKDRTYTYCSEIVWQAYYYGASTTYKVLKTTSSQTTWEIPGIIQPYDYTNGSFQSYNKVSTVRTVGW